MNLLFEYPGDLIVRAMNQTDDEQNDLAFVRQQRVSHGKSGSGNFGYAPK